MSCVCPEVSRAVFFCLCTSLFGACDPDCLCISARFFLISSSRVSSSAVTCMSLRKESDCGCGALAEVRALITLRVEGDEGVFAYVLGRESSSSWITEGCLTWLFRLLPLYARLRE